VGIVLVATLSVWVLWAHRWFTGPLRQVDADDYQMQDAPEEEQLVIDRSDAEKDGVKG
jgi:hypothetical protein